MAGVVHERVVSLLNVCYVLIMFYCVLFFGLLNLFCCCPTWAGSYPVVDGACHLAFPQDHQSHDAYRTEWWYVTGNLRDKTGHRYGVQLTLFRRRLHPASDDVVSASAWRTPQLYLVHAAITDVDAKTHSHAEDMVRAGPGLAGSVRQGNDVRIVMKKNFIQFMASGLQVHAETGNIRFTLDLETQKPLILHGEDGYSQKGPAKDSASCYSSYTRLDAHGSIARDGENITVSGSAWMDHEFSSQLLDSGVAGWDWFSLQLSTGDELMLFVMRSENATTAPFVRATWISSSGTTRSIEPDDIILQQVETWTSPETHATYPSRWKLTLVSLGIHVTIDPVLANQEMVTKDSSGIVYYEGAIDITGTDSGKPIRGVGYVEMTGYADSLGGHM